MNQEHILSLVESNIYVVDVKTYKFIYKNDSVEKITKSTEELLGVESGEELKCYTALYGYDSPCHFCKIDHFENKNDIIEFEAFNEIENKWYSLRENLIFSSNGKVAKYSVGQDITEFKKIQQDMTTGYAELMIVKEEVKVLNRDLKKKVREEVAKNRLKDAKLMEQAKMAQMGEMLGNIAHQWRQPLTSITISASSMQLEHDMGILEDHSFQESTDNIIERAEFLSKTIEDFRNFLKEDKRLKEVSLIELVESVQNIIHAAYKDNNIDLFFDVEGEIEDFNIFTIEGELSQVVLNVLNNAKDIILEKKPVDRFVKVSLKSIDKYIQIIIEDSGGGIPDNVMPKIFDPYFTTKHQSQGTGIGLYMSYEIATKHLRGKMHAQNSQNGAQFFIELLKDKREQKVEVENERRMR